MSGLQVIDGLTKTTSPPTRLRDRRDGQLVSEANRLTKTTSSYNLRSRDGRRRRTTASSFKLTLTSPLEVGGPGPARTNSESELESKFSRDFRDLNSLPRQDPGPRWSVPGDKRTGTPPRGQDTLDWVLGSLHSMLEMDSTHEGCRWTGEGLLAASLESCSWNSQGESQPWTDFIFARHSTSPRSCFHQD